MTRLIVPPTNNSLQETFNACANSPAVSVRKKPCKAASHVISFRVDDAEKSTLERSAPGLPLSRYVRERVLNGDHAPRRTRGQSPIKDHEALGRVLVLSDAPAWLMISPLRLRLLRTGVFFSPRRLTPRPARLRRCICHA
ncbi:MAG: hypothetical protein H6844_19200 [Alphaproteobacteria bacterium]|nr:hypothetical protein [Alphaproteobacteria bacterium]